MNGAVKKLGDGLEAVINGLAERQAEGEKRKAEEKERREKEEAERAEKAKAEWAEKRARLEETFAEREKEQAEEDARKKAEWDALPEDEKQRITAEREREEREHEKVQAELEREAQIEEWKRRGIPPRFYDVTWESWIAETPEQKSVLEKVKQAWNKNLFIVGKNGTGKTHLAMCLVKEGATYCEVPKLFRKVREDLSVEESTIQFYGNRKLLILDEAGRQKGTDFERNLLFEIIDKRWKNMLPTTIIGNINKKDFADLYGTAVVDRLRPEIVELNWRSKRTNSQEDKQ
jgi:DNA replication protein DnaC